MQKEEESDDIRQTRMFMRTMLVALVIVMPAACTMHRQSKIVSAVKSGADPIIARCAMEIIPSDLCRMPALAERVK